MTPTDRDPERALALSYASVSVRAGLRALFDLDAALGRVLRTTREPLVGQMRLTWWHAALEALDRASPPAEPVLRALAQEVVPKGVSGAALAGMIEAWEGLLEAPADDARALERHGSARGALLFALAGALLRAAPGDPLAEAGAAWSLADLAGHPTDPGGAVAARAVAAQAFHRIGSARWSRNARALAALALIARMDLALPPGTPPPAGAPRRVLRLAWLRLSGH